MDPMELIRSVPRLGELLVAQGVMTEREVERVLSRQQQDGRPFGALAEEICGVDPSLIEAAWIDQYRQIQATSRRTLATAEPEALALVDARQAWQFRLLPLSIDDEALVAATTTQHMARAARFASAVLGRTVIFTIVDSEELAAALERHYPMNAALGMDARTVRGGVQMDPLGGRFEPSSR